MEQEIDRQIGAVSAVMWILYQLYGSCSEDRVELKCEAINLPTHLHFISHLWSQALVTDEVVEIKWLGSALDIQ